MLAVPFLALIFLKYADHRFSDFGWCARVAKMLSSSSPPVGERNPSMTSRVRSSRFSGGSVNSFGAAGGFTTASGCRSKVTSRLTRFRARARRTISARTA